MDGNDIAQFAYDTLGRRIRKTDSQDPNNTRLYYYNNNWQVLYEYTDSNSLYSMFMYGNYIDEAVFAILGSTYAHYAHDHLYSPVALIDHGDGDILERYEYDAYGHCTFLEPNFTPLQTQKSQYANNYLFTGRRLDILDNGSLKIQYNRNRYYDYYTGRFTTHDPLGINPAGGQQNVFSILEQYNDGTNLYQYVRSNPINYVDPYGLLCVFREYRELVFAGGGIPHGGLLLGLHEDIDYGASKFPWIGARGECPFNGGVQWGKVQTWDLEIEKTNEEIKYGHPDRPLCCCATCGDVENCVRKTCQEWNGTRFWPWHKCWDFVEETKSNCCLKKK